jgi:hypothetical protein
VVLLCLKQVLLNGDKLCGVYNPDYLGDDDEKKKKNRAREKAEEGRAGADALQYVIDCHDFVEDDTVCRGTL